MMINKSTNFNEEIWKYKEDIYNFIFEDVGFSKEFADNIVQQTFEKALKNKHNYVEQGSLKYWLFRLAKNIFIDTKRRDKLGLFYTDNIEFFHVLQDNGDEKHHDDEAYEKIKNIDVKILHKMILKLPVQQQEIIKLFYFDNLNYNEIVQYTGEKLNTCLGRMHYAKKNLKKLITDYKK